MSKFLPASGLKWIEPKEFDLGKYTRNSFKKNVFSKLVLNFKKKYANYIMIIF